MTDQEVRTLAQDVQTSPAGAMDAWGWVAVIAIVGAVWYFFFRK
jgi:hypothetical protein